MGVAPVWSTACPDWESRIVEGRSLIPFKPLFQQSADEALAIFDKLIMRDAPGSPTFGEVSREWVRDFVAAIFGAYDPETGRRLIQEFFMLISKKNAKSTNAAGIMMTAVLLCWRYSGEFLILAPTVEVANNSFDPAHDMIKSDDDLAEILHVSAHTRTITHRVTGAKLKIVAASSETVSGKKAIGVLIDELWLFGKIANAGKMLLEATGGLTSRPEGFVIYTTTQSDEPPAGVFKEKLAYARDVRDGKIVDNAFLPVLYEFPTYMLEEELHLLPENFKVTNPNMGASVDEPYLIRKFRQAEMGEEGESVQDFLAKHLNVEIGLNLRRDRWPGADFWQAAGVEKALTLDGLIERSEVIVGGVDGGGLDDLLGVAVLGREMDTKKWLLWTRAWCNKIVLKRRKSIAPKLQELADLKLLSIVEAGADALEVAEIFVKIKKAKLLHQIGFDRAAVGGLIDALLQAGIPEDKIVGVAQGWQLASAIRTTERKVSTLDLVHEGNLLMDWCVSNAKVKTSGNATLVSKQMSGTGKIDPLLATFNAVNIMELNPKSLRNRYNFSDMVIGG